MTQVEILKKGKKYEIRILGHAEYAEEGKDIVCSAVSILSATLVQKLNEWDEDGELELYEKVTAPGCVKVIVEQKKEAEAEVDSLVDVIMTGYMLLEHKYSRNINVMWGEILEEI